MSRKITIIYEKIGWEEKIVDEAIDEILNKDASNQTDLEQEISKFLELSSSINEEYKTKVTETFLKTLDEELKNFEKLEINN